MKRLILIFLATIVLSFISGSACLADDGPGFGFHKMYQNKTEISLYVNGATGQDKHGHGKFSHKPFKTITFALKAIPLLRKSPEIRVTAYIAAGTYNENLEISSDNITLQGEGRDVTTILGNDRKNINTVNIVNSRKIEINDFKITNGRFGVLLTDGSSVKIASCNLSANERFGLFETRNSIAGINNTIFSDNERGLLVNRGSYVQLKDCDIMSNETGLDVTSNSVARLNDGNTISGNFPGAGIEAQFNSFVRTDGRNDIISYNGTGILIERNSSAWFRYGSITLNSGDGVVLDLDSVVHFRSQVSVTDNGGYGVACVDGKLDGLPGTIGGNVLGDYDNCNFP